MLKNVSWPTFQNLSFIQFQRRYNRSNLLFKGLNRHKLADTVLKLVPIVTLTTLWVLLWFDLSSRRFSFEVFRLRVLRSGWWFCLMWLVVFFDWFNGWIQRLDPLLRMIIGNLGVFRLLLAFCQLAALICERTFRERSEAWHEIEVRFGLGFAF